VDTALFSQYIDDHADAVRAYIWRRAGGLDAAISTPDDIAADVWVTAWQKRDEAPEPSSPGAARAWMLRIARFTLANHTSQH
jgi:DNA-directed RNA polymerase specialized sigma24 family protein